MIVLDKFDAITAKKLNEKYKKSHINRILKQIENTAIKGEKYLNIYEPVDESTREELERRGFKTQGYIGFKNIHLLIMW